MVPGFTDQDAYQSVFTIGRMEVIAAYQKQEWQQQPRVYPLTYDPIQLTEFLMAHKQIAKATPNFFNAFERSTVKLPNISKEACDIQLVVNLIRTWGPNQNLTLSQLQQKTVISLCLATMWRTTSDIGKIQLQDVSFTYNEKGTPTGATIIESEPKEGQAKRSRLGAIEESLFCPMKTSWDWMQRFHDLRIQLPVDHTLFLTYVDIDYKQTGSIRPKTAAGMVTKILTNAGIDITL
ncbi:hypothetical protein BDB00DRAFT_874835 [Zychaea mexicana]|uniref:uncharacterized protein n=1 Tax=Zychaea mexicana TaxID=64656 RepID=UPI0022FF233B|nr:uncharacterized protein BDB00DRAFT_874835 [Zychaea mexicana]KAI9490990.1 hypothetical protein BDB00DRAFT_874835 [Zychaea mexicana]